MFNSNIFNFIHQNGSRNKQNAVMLQRVESYQERAYPQKNGPINSIYYMIYDTFNVH